MSSLSEAGTGFLIGRIPWTEEPGRLQHTGLQRVNTTEVTEHAYGVYQKTGKLK